GPFPRTAGRARRVARARARRHRRRRPLPRAPRPPPPGARRLPPGLRDRGLLRESRRDRLLPDRAGDLRDHRERPALPRAAPLEPVRLLDVSRELSRELVIVTFVTRQRCHLCVEALRTVREVLAGAPKVTLELVDVDSDAELQDEYGGDVPVVLVDG